MPRITARWYMVDCTISSRNSARVGRSTRRSDCGADVARSAGGRSPRGSDRLWAPRLERIAEWVARIEAERRAVRHRCALVAEAMEVLELARQVDCFGSAAVPIGLSSRSEGGLAILDYKTGTPPSSRGSGCRPGAATVAGGRHGRGRCIRRPHHRADGRADLLASDRRLNAGEERTLFKRRCGSNRSGGGRRTRRAVFADRCIRCPGSLLSAQPQPGFAPRFSTTHSSPGWPSGRRQGMRTDERPLPRPTPQGEGESTPLPLPLREGVGGRGPATVPTRNSCWPRIRRCPPSLEHRPGRARPSC